MGSEGESGTPVAPVRAACAPGLNPVSGAAIGALLFNAFAWGISWWPFRALADRGLHVLWATCTVCVLGALVVTLWRPRAWGQLLRSPPLWCLLLAAGATNATFNWGVTIGDVVRVVLLFYLMPLWAVLLARWLLHEALTAAALLRLALALAGAAIVLWPQADAAGGGMVEASAAAWPLPRSLAEWLGLAGGFAFAMTNVLLRREAAATESARALAIFVGGAVVAGALACVLSASGTVPWPGPAPAWAAGAALLALWFIGANLALQYGATRVPANVTAVVMVSEVLFASGSASLLGASRMTPALMLGAGLIVGAALLAARR